MTEDKMIGWHHQLDGHEFEQALGVGDGLGIWHTAVHGVEKRHDWATERTPVTIDFLNLGS